MAQERTAPTEAEIRERIAAYGMPALTSDASIENYVTDAARAFDAVVETERVTDDDFYVFTRALTAETEALLPAIEAAVRPLIIEAQVRAASRFLERFPDAPRAAAEPMPA